VPVAFSRDERLEYLQEFGGHTLAYATLQPGLRYFDIPRVGFLAYERFRGRDFVLSNPICAQADLQTLLGDFIRTHESPCFVQVYRREADLLRELFHHYTVQIGVESWLDGATWTVQGRQKAHVRRWINTARNAGVIVQPLNDEQPQGEIERVSDEWRTSRTNDRKLRFLVRDFYTESAARALARPYGGFHNGKLVGVVDFAPLFSKHRAAGYYADLVRMTPGAPNGTSDLIIATAFREFIREGALALSLGLAPLAKISRCSHEPPFIRTVLSLLYLAGNRMYHFKGNYFHKEKYRGEEIPVFYTTRNRNTLIELLSVFRVVGVF